MMSEETESRLKTHIRHATKAITIGANKVTVPDKYYKVAFDLTPPIQSLFSCEVSL